MMTPLRLAQSAARAAICVALLAIAGVGRAQFTTVIDSPPTIIGDNQSIGSNTQLNVSADGVVGHRFRAGAEGVAGENIQINIAGGSVASEMIAYTGSKVNISGGTVGDALAAVAGAEIHIQGGLVGDWLRAAGGQLNISGGTVGNYLRAFGGGQVNLTGGSVGTGVKVHSDSRMNISGGDYRLDGTPIEGIGDIGSELSLDIPEGAVFSGTLVDGTPFAFSSRAIDEFAPGSLTLQSRALPPIGPDLLIASRGPIPLGIREGQTVVVDAGGVVGSGFNAGRGSTLIVEEGGTLGANLEAVAAEVVINGGSVGGRIHTYDSHVTLAGGTVDAGYYSLIASGSIVNITGGDVGPSLIAREGSQLTMSGGSIGRLSSVRDGSTLIVSGGSVGDSFKVHSGSEVTITGGRIGSSFFADDGSRVHVSGGTFGGLRATRGSQVTVTGGEFRLNGVLIEGLESTGARVSFDIPGGAVLSGVFADGTPFAFGSYDLDYFADGTLTLESALLPPIGPARIVASTDPVPLGVRQGQTLIVDAGGTVGESFNAGRGSTVIVEEGGFVGSNLEAVGAEVTIRGGTVNAGMDISDGSQATISGGTVGDEYYGGFSVYDSEVIVSGGSILRGISALRNSRIAITGGSVGNASYASDGSQITISGGSIGDNFNAYAGSRVDISGGTLGDSFRAGDQSRITVSGGEFRLDGALVEGLESIGSTKLLNLPRHGVLSGVLADGTPFAFSHDDRDSLPIGTLTLQRSALPSIGPAQIVASKDAVPLGIREGQTLLVDAGGVVADNFNAGRGSTVFVEEGGTVGDNFEAVEAEVTITGGTVGGNFHAFNGSQVTISGGVVADQDGTSFRASESRIVITGGVVGHPLITFDGSDVTIAGGTVAWELTAHQGSLVNLSGGLVRGTFETHSGSHVTLAGGTLVDKFVAWEGSRVTISGGEFYLDGDRIGGLGSDGATMPFDLPDGALLSGVFADGTPFAFTSVDWDSLEAGTLTLQSNPLPPIGPATIVASTDPVPLGIRQGQTLVVDAGGVVAEGFNAGRGSTVIVKDGGVVNRGFEAVGAELKITGGTVKNGPEAFDGAHVTISGGSVNDLQVHVGSHVDISGGSVRSSSIYGGTAAVTGGSLVGFYAQDASRVTIAGGSFADLLSARTGSQVTISGGVFDGQIHAWSGSHVNIMGSGFTLGESELSGLIPGQALVVEARDLALAGVLADGTPFRFDLYSSLSTGNDYFEPSAMLTVTLLVPEPTAYWIVCCTILAGAMMRTLPRRR